jgi:uncharacterized cofD-like protein
MMARFLKWLYPGMRVKRWMALLIIGILLISGGLWLVVGIEILAGLESLVTRRLLSFTGRFPVYASVTLGGTLIALGIFLVATGFRQTVHTLLAELAPEDAEDVASIMFERRHLRRGPHVVVIGGGTGLATLLRGMKEHTSNITAIVAMADDGGSSGRLREDFGTLPPGDIRNTLVALADTEPLMEALFQYRFSAGHGLEGHSFGNLFITAMHQIAGDFEHAVRQSSKVLAIRGRVLPSTLQSVILRAVYQDGTEARGESHIPQDKKRIERVYLEPPDALPVNAALEAIDAADAILLGPGSLYTSVIPNLLVQSVADRIRASAALKVYICNVMTQPGETDGFDASEHLRAILEHGGPGLIHYCLLNSAAIPQHVAKRYENRGAHAVATDTAKIRELGITPVMRPLIDESDLARHHPQKLAEAIMELVRCGKRPQPLSHLFHK